MSGDQASRGAHYDCYCLSRHSPVGANRCSEEKELYRRVIASEGNPCW